VGAFVEIPPNFDLDVYCILGNKDWNESEDIQLFKENIKGTWILLRYEKKICGA
jgi:hypothetical protein